MSRRRPFTHHPLARLVVPLSILAIWELTARLLDSPFMSTLPEIAVSFYENWIFAHVFSDLVPSLYRMVVGFVLGVTVGVAGGLVLGERPLLRVASWGFVEFFRSLPPTALIPPIIIIFGIGSDAKIALIAFASCWPVLLNIQHATAEIDSTLQDTLRIYPVRWWTRTRLILIPAVLRPAMAGIRTSLALALIMVIVSELVGSTDGLGYFILASARTFSMPDMWSGLLVISLVGVGMSALFDAFEKRVFRRFPPTAGSGRESGVRNDEGSVRSA